MPKARKPAWSMELLPRAVFALGITGHRDLGANSNTSVIAATLDTLFANLSRAVRTVGQNEFFSKAAPLVRAVTMAAEGADLLGAQAAQNAGSAVVYVLPFPFDEYQRDFLRQRRICTLDPRTRRCAIRITRRTRRGSAQL